MQFELLLVGGRVETVSGSDGLTAALAWMREHDDEIVSAWRDARPSERMPVVGAVIEVRS